MATPSKNAPDANQQMIYWGEGGKHGPFAVQANGEWAGWPDFGQVMRYFRKKAKLSAAVFGAIYGAEANEDGSPVSARWIHEMESQNRVPVDITKRRTIARLLKIPPMLFGLATLDDLIMDLKPYPQAPFAAATGATRVQRSTLDLTPYQVNNATLWHIHATSNASGAIGQLQTDMRALEMHEKQTQGDLQYCVREMLLSDHTLATHIVRDQRQFQQAYYHANESVRVAKSMEDSDLLAAALFSRGWTRLEWGLFGTIEQGMFQVQQDQLEAAIRDFRRARDLFPTADGKENMHPQLLGILTAELQRAQAALALHQGERVPASVFIELDDASQTVDQQLIANDYTRVLLKGDRAEWNQATYLNTRATIFSTAGLPGPALRELSLLESLTEKTYSRDETRRFVWLDLLKANIYMGLEEWGPAASIVKQALLTCQDINSTTNIAIVTDIYGRLRQTSHRESGQVHEIGELLRKSSAMLSELPEEE